MTERIKLGKAIERWREGVSCNLAGRVTFQLEEVYCTKRNRFGQAKRYGPYGPYWYVYYWTGNATPPPWERPKRGESEQRSRYFGKPGNVDPMKVTPGQLGKLLKERQPVRLVDTPPRGPAQRGALVAPRAGLRRAESITLVACAVTKGEIPTEAKRLYRSDWFRKARAYAEARQRAFGDPWFILSAKHGLVHPDAELAPYDYPMKIKSPGARREWAEDVSDQVLTAAAELGMDPMLTGSAETIRMLAGQQYRQYLVPLLKASGFRVLVPMERMGIGEQKRWLVESAGEVRAEGEAIRRRESGA